MTKDEKAELDSLLKDGDGKPMTKDEVITAYKLTEKRIQEIEQKAVNKLTELSKKNNPNPEDNSVDPDTVQE
jgi:DNA-directed RNA polymerase sigma subunit (sigma70/sigma32)